jgi:hypothetical protein
MLCTISLNKKKVYLQIHGACKPLDIEIREFRIMLKHFLFIKNYYKVGILI